MEYTEDKTLTEWIIETTNDARNKKSSLKLDVSEYRSNIQNYMDIKKEGIVYEEQLKQETLDFVDSLMHYKEIKQILDNTISRQVENMSEHVVINNKTYDKDDVREEINEIVDFYDEFLEKGWKLCLEAEDQLESSLDPTEVARKKHMKRNNISKIGENQYVSIEQDNTIDEDAVEMFFTQEFSS